MATFDVTRRARSRSATALVLLAVAAGTGCTRIDNALASVPVFAYMRSSPAFDPYEHPLPPPPGAIPFESPGGLVLPPLEATDQALREFAASPLGVNPLAADDAAALALGQVMYDRHCSVCHGVEGRGDGPVIGQGKFPLAPSLVVAPATGLSDGYVYGVVRAGRGLMPAYGARMTHIERWAVVNYVNHLQGAAGVAPQPAPADTTAATTMPAPAPGTPAEPAAPAADTAATPQ
ncbi:MAG TPA: cytochrome c [Longimicrobiales bacterium]|nr:cytochrome c [Longimicrobiales bacterium]